MAIRFLQIGDTHLGAKLVSHPTDVAEGLREATREVLRGAFETVKLQGLDLVVMPGDLYEKDGVDPAEQLRFIYELAGGLSPVPVVIAPGNHDPYGPDSPYATEQRPRNVHLFTSPQLQALDTPAGTVVGRAYQEGEGYSSIDWSSLPLPPPEPGLLVLHASVLHAEDGRPHSRVIVPTTEERLLESGYAYTALGHYHLQREFRRTSSLAYAAYAGCPQGHGWYEAGPRGYITGELETGGAVLEFHPAALRTWKRHTLELPPEYAADADERLIDAVRAVRGQLAPSDLLSLRVHGRWPLIKRPELELKLAELIDAVWHTRPVDFSGVDFTPELVPPGTSDVLDAFLKHCREQAEVDEQHADAWELARYLGHRLLSGQGLPEEVAR